MFKNSIFFLSFFTFALGFSQVNLDAYKYVIVPNRYDFLKKADEFQLNSISEFLFNKHGFIALKENAEFPEDLKNNKCLALTSNVLNDKNLFKTKLTIVLNDCNNKQVYKSKVGESREKDYKTSYNQALRAAFKSLSLLNHNYKESDVSKSITASKKLTETKTNKVGKTIASVKNASTQSLSSTSTLNVLYAQTIDNGFQLVDSTPKVIFKLLKTSVENVFLVEGKEAIIYKSNASWILEFYENGGLKQQGLNIKF